jgi:integrase
LLSRKRGDGLSKNTVRLIRATLSVLLADAVEDGILTMNPTLGLARRGRKTPDSISQAERQRKIRPLSHEQLTSLLGYMHHHCPPSEYTLFLLLADTGMRPGEALALAWDDFDETGRTLHVERAVSLGQVKPTKTEESRTVDLTARLAEAVRGWQAARETEALMNGTDPSPWVFPNPRGGFLDPKVISRHFRGLLRRAGLPRFRLYDLRHTYSPARRGSTDHLRGGTTWALEADHDASPLCSLAPSRR